MVAYDCPELRYDSEEERHYCIEKGFRSRCFLSTCINCDVHRLANSDKESSLEKEVKD
jgi:hypothetical protein